MIDDEEYTLESYYSSVSFSESQSDSESDTLKYISTISTKYAIATNNRNRVNRLNVQLLQEEDVPTAIVSRSKVTF